MPGVGSTSTTTLISLSAYNDDVHCVFFLEKYFAFGNWNDDLQSNRDWFWRALQSPTAAPVSSVACRSLVTAFSANKHGSQVLKRTALDSHRMALKALRRAVGHQETTFDVISAVLLLAMYEACSMTMRASWYSHIGAIKRLIATQGPAFFSQRPARSLLMMARHNIIIECFMTKERCFLEDTEWADILKSDDRESSLTLRLGDLVVKLPGIIHEIGLLKPAEDQDSAARLLDQLVQHLADLKTWWKEWSADPSRLPVRIAAPKDLEGPEPPPLPGNTDSTVLGFCNLEAAAGYCRYHAHVILAMKWINRLLNISGLTLPTHMVDPALATEAHGHHYARISDSTIEAHALAICEGLRFYSLPQYRSIGAVYLTLPARVAYEALPPESPHALWIKDLLEFLAGTSGFTIPRHILYCSPIHK